VVGLESIAASWGVSQTGEKAASLRGSPDRTKGAAAAEGAGGAALAGGLDSHQLAAAAARSRQ